MEGGGGTGGAGSGGGASGTGGGDRGTTTAELVKFVIGALVPLGSILAFGEITGGAELARRNNAGFLLAAVILVILGIGFGLIALAMKNDDGWQTGFLLWAGMLVIAGCILAAIAVLDREPGRPVIDATMSFDERATLKLAVRAGGLASHEEVQLLITGHREDVAGDEPQKHIVRSSFGPNAEGDVEHTLELPIPPGEGDYDVLLVRAWIRGGDAGTCRVEEARGAAEAVTGCLAIPLPEALPTTGASEPGSETAPPPPPR